MPSSLVQFHRKVELLRKIESVLNDFYLELVDQDRKEEAGAVFVALDRVHVERLAEEVRLNAGARPRQRTVLGLTSSALQLPPEPLPSGSSGGNPIPTLRRSACPDGSFTSGFPLPS